MRTLATAAIAATAVLGLAACGSSSGSAKSITFIAGNKANGFYINMACGVKAAAKKAGVAVTLTGPTQFAPTAQMPVIQAVAAKSPKAVIIGPTDATALTPTLKQMQGTGTKLVVVDQDITDTSVGISRIASDNEQGGRQAADAMAQLIGEKGEVLVLDIAPGSAASGLRAKGFTDQIKKYPGITLVGTQYDQSDATRAASLVSATLAAHPNLAGVFADANEGALGTVTAVRSAGKTGTVKVIGFDADPAEIAALKAGTIDALVTQRPYEIGESAVTAALAAMDGKKVEATEATGTTLVTPENVDDPSVSKYFYTDTCS
jgi:ABC-type sugar transport system substrate-binding protein